MQSQPKTLCGFSMASFEDSNEMRPPTGSEDIILRRNQIQESQGLSLSSPTSLPCASKGFVARFKMLVLRCCHAARRRLLQCQHQSRLLSSDRYFWGLRVTRSRQQKNKDLRRRRRLAVPEHIYKSAAVTSMLACSLKSSRARSHRSRLERQFHPVDVAVFPDRSLLYPKRDPASVTIVSACRS